MYSNLFLKTVIIHTNYLLVFADLPRTHFSIIKSLGVVNETPIYNIRQNTSALNFNNFKFKGTWKNRYGKVSDIYLKLRFYTQLGK